MIIKNNDHSDNHKPATRCELQFVIIWIQIEGITHDNITDIVQVRTILSKC